MEKVAIRAGLAAGLIVAFVSTDSFAWSGKVVAVQEGDASTAVDQANIQHKIRLASIYGPELGQPLGETAKQASP
ncbi:MAG: hypothetical protein IPK66_05930 [Rhodospirillales bacterium]|nr:hypothetical protein [Rhodospirillales bacterium]